MASRTTQAVVTFSSKFLLPNFDGPQPPGDYRVDYDEESLEAGAWSAWRSVGSFIHLPAIGVGGLTQQMVPVATADLDAAIEKDRVS